MNYLAYSNPCHREGKKKKKNDIKKKKKKRCGKACRVTRYDYPVTIKCKGDAEKPGRNIKRKGPHKKRRKKKKEKNRKKKREKKKRRKKKRGKVSTCVNIMYAGQTCQ